MQILVILGALGNSIIFYSWRSVIWSKFKLLSALQHISFFLDCLSLVQTKERRIATKVTVLIKATSFQMHPCAY